MYQNFHATPWMTPCRETAPGGRFDGRVGHPVATLNNKRVAACINCGTAVHIVRCVNALAGVDPDVIDSGDVRDVLREAGLISMDEGRDQ